MGSCMRATVSTMKNLCYLLVILVPSLAIPDGGYGDGGAVGPAQYAYQYGAEDGATNNNFGQAESRSGANAEGEYFVNLPDGRLQKVSYSVNGDGGYVADVSYTGEPQYPPEPSGGYGRK